MAKEEKAIHSACQAERPLAKRCVCHYILPMETYEAKHPLRLLPPELANQIAAGEVVERPTSAVKELVENSLDADARHIAVHIENGGQSLIRVEDDGTGLLPEDLPLALTRHATSKVASLPDLFRIHSFGFRGEALPSIASVSRLTFASAPRNASGTSSQEASGSKLTVEFGKVGAISPCALNSGTCVEVRDLFHNMPARVKFLKNPSTELKNIQEYIGRMALARTDVAFRLLSGGREIYHFAASNAAPMPSLQARLLTLWPPSITENLLPFDTRHGEFRAWGLASAPHIAQARANHIFLYVNGRPVQDKLLMRAARDAYQGRLISKEYPAIVLFVECPPDMVDVNVHPAKSEVRFRDEKSVFSCVIRAVQSATLTAPTMPQMFKAPDTVQNSVQGDPEISSLGEQSPAKLWQTLAPENSQPVHPKGFWGRADEASYRHKTPLTPIQEEYTLPHAEDKGEDFCAGNANSPSLQNGYNGQNFATPRPFGASSGGFAEQAVPFAYHAENASATPKEYAGKYADAPSFADNAQFSSQQFQFMGQWAKTYLLFRQGDDTLCILDQHAAHERILYERLCRQKNLGNSRPFLLPLELALHPAEEARLHDITPALHSMGFVFRISQGTIFVEAGPAELDRAAIAGFLRDILAEQADSLENALIEHACKSALRAGHSMDAAAAYTLLRAWLATEEPDFCPHGRPCALSFSTQDMEKMFKRKG